jgi:hypothetical protein
MSKSKYEQERDANIKSIRDVFASLGINVLAETVNSALSKEQVGKWKALESEKPETMIPNLTLITSLTAKRIVIMMMTSILR